MPEHNHFRHQAYEHSDSAEVEWISAGAPVAPRSGEFVSTMHRVSARLREADIRAIYLVHGTFVGDDVLGWVRKLRTIWPSSSEWLQQLHKQLADGLMQDAGNYTVAFAGLLERALNLTGQSSIPVRLFRWSGENHHVGRADAAVRLLHELEESGDTNGRVLIWGHSHGGNVLALLTNLLGADRETLQAFFHAARSYYRWPGTRHVDQPIWRQMQRLLRSGNQHTRGERLDIVTFGTPIRYGWDRAGYARLAHVVNHRPQANLRPDCAAFPPSVEDVLDAAHGDCVQQLGIAGTNWPPTVASWRAWVADSRLNELLQAGIRARDLLDRLRVGLRVADEGRNFLVDYGCVTSSVVGHHAGHAVYTLPDWLAFHAELVASRLYS